ncbi:MAG: hypothetical protein V4607_02125 [Pseudomonadota bacterium]
MTPRDFCYWLNGLLELQPDLKTLDEPQVHLIREHLGVVFTQVMAAPEAADESLRRLIARPASLVPYKDDTTFC